MPGFPIFKGILGFSYVILTKGQYEFSGTSSMVPLEWSKNHSIDPYEYSRNSSIDP